MPQMSINLLFLQLHTSGKDHAFFACFKQLPSRQLALSLLFHDTHFTVILGSISD